MASSPQKPTAEHYEQASHWVSLLHDSVATPGQVRTFKAWLARSPAHKQAYHEVEAFWQQLDGLQTIAKPQLAAARAYARKAQNQHHWLLPRHSLALAASILLLVIAFPVVQLCLDNGSYRTAKGEQQRIRLSDGTRIDLNTDTEVQVTYTFFDRKVRLEQGEALFTVQHDADKPFEVVAADGLIRDIGTQFNVYRQGNKVAVTVLEGEVSISNNTANAAPQMLTAGMSVGYDRNGLYPLADNGDANDVAAWREGRIVFKGQRLDAVLQQLSRYHAVKLGIGNSKLAALKVSGNFPTKDLNLALNTIAASLSVKITRQGTGSVVLGFQGKARK